MLKTVMRVTGMVGIAAFSVCPSLAALSTDSWTHQPQRTIEKLYITPEIHPPNEHSYGSLQYFAQRESSTPPRESHSGRASSSPAGKIPESKRESGRTLDLSEHPSNLETESTSHQSPEESRVTPKKEGDPLEGERKSQPPFKRRGGVVN